MFKKFFKSEIAIGILLIIASVTAMLAANSAAFQIYHDFAARSKNFVNDGLMVIFFLLIGLELKKEILIGELASRKKIILPLIAALGGVVLPCLIFIAFNFSDAEKMRAFAVPSATDIAFAYGIISLFGKKISNSLKVFLIALATIDDLIAIFFIGFFYSKNLQIIFLILALIPLCFLAVLNLKKSKKISLYLISGFVLWFLILKSGVHPTLSGVLLALFIPLEVNDKPILTKISHKISVPVNFFILPLFAFANAGVKITNFSAEIFSDSLVLGIIFGLFFGKQIGVFLFSFFAVKINVAHLPKNTGWTQFYAASIFTGIGFTMSLFIANLAFDPAEIFLLNKAKIAILIASIFSIIYGSLIIFSSRSKSPQVNSSGVNFKKI